LEAWIGVDSLRGRVPALSSSRYIGHPGAVDVDGAGAVRVRAVEGGEEGASEVVAREAPVGFGAITAEVLLEGHVEVGCKRVSSGAFERIVGQSCGCVAV